MKYHLTLTEDERALVLDALEIVSPDNPTGQRRRDALLTTIGALDPIGRPRLLVTLDQGLVETVAIEGLDGVEIELVRLDLDTDGSDESDGAMRVDGDLMFVTVEPLARMTVDEAALARMARDTWKLTR